MRLQLLAAYCIGALVGTIIPATAADNIDHRARVDIGVYPWSSVGKIYNSTGGACTGSLIGPNKVLTAAHCIFNERTRIGRSLRFRLREMIILSRFTWRTTSQ